jgi:hypothetical protein
VKDENVRWFARFMAPASLVGTIVALLILLFAGSSVRATDWYAQDGSGNMSTRHWDATPTGGGADLTWASRTLGDVFYANAQTGIAIDADPGANGKVTLSNAAGAGTVGGAFTYATATNIDLNIDVVSGADTTLTVTGSTGKFNLIGNITGTAGRAIYCSVTIISSTITGNISSATGGEMGLYHGGTGAITINGNCTGGSAYGCYANNGAVVTVNGNCVSSNIDSTSNAACSAIGGSTMIVTGNIIHNTTESSATRGKIRWQPSSAQKYVLYDGGGTKNYAGAGVGSDAGGTQVTGANTAALIPTGTYFIKKDDGVYTQGSKAASGGTWAF